MTIIESYLGKQVIVFILLVTLALLGFDLFFNLVYELKFVGRGQYTLAAAFTYLLLIIPGRIYMLFPWAALIGTLIGLSLLANHSELVVMRTVGISIARITYAVLKAAFILMLLAVFLGEGIAPFTERLAQDKKTLALSDGQTIQTAFGLWVRQRKEFIHVQAVRSNGELLGVTCYQFDNHRKLKTALFAQSAIKNGKGWILQQVQGTRFLPNKTEVFQEKQQPVSYLLNPEILKIAMVKHPERLSLLALMRTIRHRTRYALNTQAYKLALFTKLFQPIVILMMVFLAVPFIFGPLRSASTGFRVVVGIIVAFLFNTVNHLFAPLAIVYEVPPLLAVLVPIGVFSAVGFWILWRTR